MASYETLYRSVEDVCVQESPVAVREAPGETRGARLYTREGVESLRRRDGPRNVPMRVRHRVAGALRRRGHDQARVPTWTARVGARAWHRRRRETSGEPPRAIWDVGVALFREALVEKTLNEGPPLITGLARSPPPRRETAKTSNRRANRSVERERESRVRDGASLDATRLAARGVSRLIERERDGGSRDGRGLTRRATRAFVALRFYRETFEPMFLESTAVRYAREGDELRARSTPSRTRGTARRACESRDVRRRAGRGDDAARGRGRRAVPGGETPAGSAGRRVHEGVRGEQNGRVGAFYTLARRCGGGGGGGGDVSTTPEEPRRRRPCRRGRLREVRGCRAPRVRVEPP